VKNFTAVSCPAFCSSNLFLDKKFLTMRTIFFILIETKIFKRSSHSFAFVLLDEHLSQRTDILRKFKHVMILIFCNFCHLSNFINFDSSIFPYKAFDNDTIFFNMRGPFFASVFSGSSFSAIRESYYFSQHRDFLSVENFLAVNTH
jgi:hypothetical protein